MHAKDVDLDDPDAVSLTEIHVEPSAKARAFVFESIDH